MSDTCPVGQLAPASEELANLVDSISDFLTRWGPLLDQHAPDIAKRIREMEDSGEDTCRAFCEWAVGRGPVVPLEKGE